MAGSLECAGGALNSCDWPRTHRAISTTLFSPLTACPTTITLSCSAPPASLIDHTPAIHPSCRGAPNLRRLTIKGLASTDATGPALLRFLLQPEEGSRDRQLLSGVRELRLEVGWGVTRTVQCNCTGRSCSS